VPGTPLTAQDEAILRLEGAILAGHTCKVIVLDGDAPSLGELRARVSERLPRVPALLTRLDGAPGRMSWVPAEDFDVDRHVIGEDARPIEPEEIRERVGRLFTQHLDRTLPLWRMDTFALSSGGSAIAWRLHHTLADGTTAMRYAQALLWDAADGSHGTRAADGPPAMRAARAGAPHAASGHDEARRRAHLARFFAREFGRARSPFDGDIGMQRDVAFARLALSPLHRAARQLAGATVNDAVLSAIGGGLARWLERRHGQLGSVRVKVPVSLHRPGDGVGNADSFFFVAVPLEPRDPVERLRAVRAATAQRKSEHDAETMDRLLRDLRAVSPRLSTFCERIERSPRAFALNVSNVPGPRESVSVCGAPVKSLHSIAEIAEHHAVRVAATSLCDDMFLGFCADPAIVEHVQSLAEATEAAAQELIAAA
jgi:WS/DGAT/MGAT family acyltransferase